MGCSRMCAAFTSYIPSPRLVAALEYAFRSQAAYGSLEAVKKGRLSSIVRFVH